MTIWTMMNWAAWALSAFFVYLMAVDFIKVEKARFRAKEQGK